MLLESRDGARVDLRVIRRQRSELRGLRAGDADWSTDWLVVRGQVRLADGVAWTYQEPCLTPWEGQRLGSWLRAVAGPDDGSPPLLPRGSGLVFTEPLLSLAYDDAREDRRLVRVHLTGSAGLPDPGGAGPRGGGVALDLDAGQLRRAADDWAAELTGTG